MMAPEGGREGSAWGRGEGEGEAGDQYTTLHLTW